MSEQKPKYGGRGRPWHADFIKYMEFIVSDPNYAGMPDVYYEPGRIQWEAPSNRATGQFKDTHSKRLKWWSQKASQVGILTSTDQWISKVAKKIHPTKKKPCKICGRVLEVRYAYPQERFLAKIRKLPFVQKDFPLDRLEHITLLITRLVEAYGKPALDAIPSIFKVSQNVPVDLAGWLDWLQKTYIPSEPEFMSPGAMSNAPDRFEGFHSDNLCCRGTADKGRHKENMKTYTTDRRVFEYWTSGDWIAADRLMGLLRDKRFSGEACRNGHPGPCDVDHIGPISLGFTHRPRFQMLCSSCNSSKNNRMSKSDIDILLQDEASKVEVISWHSKTLWDMCKGKVGSDEHARRLSKLLRDNRHTLMHALHEFSTAGAFSFLVTFLELERADFDVEFTGLRVEQHLSAYDKINHTTRTTKLADEQKARRCRIAFQALTTYFGKKNRNAHVVNSTTGEQLLSEAKGALRKKLDTTKELDEKLKQAAASKDADSSFRAILPQVKGLDTKEFAQARELLQKHMDEAGKLLAARWDDERYTRELSDDVETEEEE